MFQFRLARIPVQVHLSHLLISTLLAWSFAQSERNAAAWPGAILTDADHPERGSTLALVMLVWGLIISVSVLVHELGHALTAQAYGYQPTIQLIGLGGRTMPNAPGAIPWYREVLLTLAGPSAGLALGIVAALVLKTLEALGGANPVLAYALEATFLANLFWALVNLVPVSPLDGGHIVRAILTHLFGRPGFLYTQYITLVFAALGFGLSIFLKAPLPGLLFGLWGFQAITLVQAYHRGALPEGAALHPLQQRLDEAMKQIQARRLDEATRTAEDVLRTVDVPALVKARAHLVLGLIGVKRSDGAAALRHFRNVEGLPVPPHALAAAHSLAGDDATALPLWGEAARVVKDPVVRAELAGTLLRLDREAEARALPELRFSLAALAAERVLYLRGEYARAARMAELAFQDEPTAAHAYTAACDWARANDADGALRCLALAAQNGFGNAAEARADPDLASLRSNPAFEAWLTSLPAPMTNG